MENRSALLRFSLRTLMEIVVGIAVVLGFAYHVNQKDRYQFITVPEETKESISNADETASTQTAHTDAFLFDSATGKVWYRIKSGIWKLETQSNLAKLVGRRGAQSDQLRVGKDLAKELRRRPML